MKKKHMRAHGEQRRETQVILAENLLEHRFIELAHVKKANLAFHVAHVLDDIRRALLQKREVILILAVLLDELDERERSKRVMLRRYRETALWLHVPVLILQKPHLLYDLARVAEEMNALVRELYAARRANEQRLPNLRLELTQRVRNARLRDEHVARGTANRAELRDGVYIFELQQRHVPAPFFDGFSRFEKHDPLRPYGTPPPEWEA